MTDKKYYQYWGKAAKGDNSYHLLVYHSLDVAAVGMILAKRLFIAKHIGDRLGYEEQDTVIFIAFLCAIHDVGKFSDGFQNQRPDLVKILSGTSLTAAYQEKHWSSGYRFLRAHADKIFSGDKDVILDSISSWLSASAGHHGRPPIVQMGALPIEAQFPSQVTNNVICDLRKIIGVSDDSRLLSCNEQQMRELSWMFAGVVVLADWIGSNSRWFPYQSDTQSLQEYWQTNALPQAERAIQESGVIPLSPAKTQGVQQIFTHIKQPTSLQDFAGRWEITGGQSLFIMEEITGAGKTEAALMLAHRLISAGYADGIYFGLPTMATANAMHERVEVVYRKFYAEGANPSLILAHSASRQYLALEQDAIEQNDMNETDNAATESREWLFDNRKKALLANVGVGTIDQALLAVLPARHQSLRLLGLHRKVLIVDEVHAYDSYMNKLLCVLLKFHAEQGGNAILLSATLPLALRKEFVSSFADGQGLRLNPKTVLSNAYPLISSISQNSFSEKSIETPVRLHRKVKVETVHDESGILDFIQSAVKNGKNVCWIHNTVFDAQQAYEKISENYQEDKMMLFHARFALGDRLLIEKEIVKNFGALSNADTRKGKVVMATQVVEQSLDIDFDCMISDLAPIDLIIQRAGRLCRHRRDMHGNCIDGSDQRGVPELYVYMPNPDEEITGDWYKNLFSKASGVYEHHGQLWLTARWLVDNGKFHMPQDAREMIEYVYGEKAQENIPNALERQENRAGGGDRAKTGFAQIQALNIEAGYMPDGFKWLEDEKVPTRISDQRTTVRLAVWHNDSLIPYFQDGKGNDWALSEISVSRFRIAGEGETHRKAIDMAKDDMPDNGKFCVVIPLEEKNGNFTGTATNAQGNMVKILYDRKRGLRFET